VFGRREAGWRTREGRLLSMVVVFKLLRGRWERGGAVADTKGNCPCAQLRTRRQSHRHIAAVGRRRVRARLVRRVEGRGQLGGYGQLARHAVGSRPLCSTIGGRGDAAAGPVLRGKVWTGGSVCVCGIGAVLQGRTCRLHGKMDMVLCRLCGRSSQDWGVALALALRGHARVWRQGSLRLAGLGQLLRGRLLLHGGRRSRRTLRHGALVGLVGRDGPRRREVDVARARQAVGDGRHDARERAAGLSLRCRRRLGHDGRHGGGDGGRSAGAWGDGGSGSRYQQPRFLPIVLERPGTRKTAEARGWGDVGGNSRRCNGDFRSTS
jgi:hypothetical protein